MTRKSINQIYLKIRRRVAQEAMRVSLFGGVAEVDEIYFGAKRVRGKRGRGASGKTIVFCIFKRNGSVYTEIVPAAVKRRCKPLFARSVEPESVIHSDGWRGYDGLVDVGYSKHFRVNHFENQFADGSNHVNGIESFRSSAKRRL